MVHDPTYSQWIAHVLDMMGIKYNAIVVLLCPRDELSRIFCPLNRSLGLMLAFERLRIRSNP